MQSDGREELPHTIRKKLSFDSDEEDTMSSTTKSWYNYASSDSDWLQSGVLDLEGSEHDDDDPSLSGAHLAGESVHKGEFFLPGPDIQSVTLPPGAI